MSTGLYYSEFQGDTFVIQAEAEAVARASLWLEKINLIHRADDPAGDLPYGDQRRLEINPIFDWFREDFGDLYEFMLRYATAERLAALRRARDEHDTTRRASHHGQRVARRRSVR